jgi:hypothetical protein
MRAIIVIVLFLIPAAFLFGYLDYEQIFTFDSSDPYAFICPTTGEASFYQFQVGGVVETALEPYAQGWMMGTVTQPGYVGFRSGQIPFVNPVYVPSGAAMSAYTPLETDQAGDSAIPQDFLDIVETRVSFDSSRIYFAIKTASQTYPVSSGYSFFAYMPVLVNPYVDPLEDPAVYGLMYTVDLGITISPGLYKISGISLDGITRIGDIAYSELGGWLLLSCAISDIVEDAEVAEWYNPDYPLFATITTTSQITLTQGIQEADYTTGSGLLLKKQQVSLENLFSPVLQELEYSFSEDYLYLNSLMVNYSDPDSNVPHLAFISLDTGEQYPLELYSVANPVFSEGVIYGLEDIFLPSQWQEMHIIFSDGEDYLEELIQRPISNADANLCGVPALQIQPNPARDISEIKSEFLRPTVLDLYNSKGQRLDRLSIPAGKQITGLDMSSYASGIYFLKAKGLKAVKLVKFQ